MFTVIKKKQPGEKWELWGGEKMEGHTDSTSGPMGFGVPTLIQELFQIFGARRQLALIFLGKLVKLIRKETGFPSMEQGKEGQAGLGV
jgi:hypothetical protein